MGDVDRQTILVVEDDPLLRISLADELRRDGFHVIEAATADQAMLAIENYPVDLVCTDVQMPGTIDGLGLVHWVISAHPEILVSVISGSTKAVSEALTVCQPELVFLKPKSVESMVTAFREALGAPKRWGGTGAA